MVADQQRPNVQAGAARRHSTTRAHLRRANDARYVTERAAGVECSATVKRRADECFAGHNGSLGEGSLSHVPTGPSDT